MTTKTNIGVAVGVVLGSPATYDEAGYDALTYSSVGNVTSLLDVGGEADVSSYDPMDTGIRVKLPGVIDYGSGSIEVAFDGDDAGQTVLSDGFDGAGKGLAHSFELTDSEGDSVWFTSKIYSFRLVYGSTGDVIGATINIEIDTSLTTSA